MAVEKFIRYARLAVGLMVFEKFIRYASLAVGMKPSARGCEGRLHGLYRIIPFPVELSALVGVPDRTVTPCGAIHNPKSAINNGIMYSKTISPRLGDAKAACAACDRFNA